jgi:hypothetical protein
MLQQHAVSDREPDKPAERSAVGDPVAVPVTGAFGVAHGDPDGRTNGGSLARANDGGAHTDAHAAADGGSHDER